MTSSPPHPGNDLPLAPAAVALAGASLLVMILVTVAIHFGQTQLDTLARTVQERTAPEVLANNNRLRNLERLYHFGEIVVNSPDDAERNRALAFFTIIAAHPSLQTGYPLTQASLSAKAVMAHVDALLQEADNAELRNDRAGQETARKLRAQAKREWTQTSVRLQDLADQLAQSNAQLLSHDTQHIATAVYNVKLRLALGLSAVFVLLLGLGLTVKSFLVAPVLSISAALRRARNGEPLGIIPDSRLREINELNHTAHAVAVALVQQQVAKMEFQRLSETDELTGLPNRRSFMSHAETLLQLAQQQGTRLSMLMVDLDNFKRANDRHGHAFGDHVLKVFAAVLRQHLRDADIPGRLGGEEFAVVLPGVSSEQARVIAERLGQALREQEFIGCDEVPHQQTVSIGLTTLIPEATSTIDDLLSLADNALYAAKAAGRDQVCVR